MNAFALVGHGEVIARLTAALDADRLPHALIFGGPAGIGKARAALRLAAYVACRAAAPPCGTCAACAQVAAGTHPDFHWLSLPAGKKEIGVDLARRLKRFVQMRPVSAARKVAVVDDAERLSIAAQNALLKTLEEPPGEALLVLVTATPGALLATVRSRCRLVVFSPLSAAEVRAVLEDGGLDAEEAEALARAAEGSPGRALHRRRLLQEPERRELLDALADLDPARYGSVLAMTKRLGRNEQEMAARLEELLVWYRDQAVGGAAEVRSAAPAQVSSALRGAELVNEALRTLRHRNPNRPLLAEALLLRLARL
jgi:DNA polymerase-3 subunit delta'